MKIGMIGFLLQNEELIDGYISKYAFYEYWDRRIEILNSISSMDDIDLIITANNFIVLTPPKLEQGLSEYLKDFIVLCSRYIDNKKPIIFGGDFYNSHIAFNPYFGTDSFCCFLVPVNSHFEQNNSIWESWSDGSCNSSAFIEQNSNRKIQFQDKQICLLSCGDILSTCHKQGAFLPDADIFLSIAHINFKKWTLEDKRTNFETHIHRWKNNNNLIVLVTQNVTYDVTHNKQYFNRLTYQLIWPSNYRRSSQTTLFNERCEPVGEFSDANYFLIKINL